MRKKKHIPTSLIIHKDKEKEPLVIKPRQKHTGRKWRLWWYLLIWTVEMLWLIVRRKATPIAKAIVTRELFEKLGFLWVKVGQFVSLRVDLFSKEFCHELSKLQYQAYGFPPEVAKQIIEEDLGGPVENFFSSFDPYPIAAASIAQVHQARLKREREDVVIKVMRPQADTIFIEDMKFLSLLLRLMNMIPALKFLDLPGALWELQNIIKEEVDYRYEVSNIRRLRKNLKKHKVYIPKPFYQYCTAHIIVMEKIDGILMSDYLIAHKNNPNGLATWIDENKVNPRRVARKLLLTYYRQVLEENLFHGDLHPGNIFLLKKGKICLIDFGSIGTLDHTLLQKYLLYVKAVVAKDYDKAADMFLSMSPQLPVVDLTPVREEIIRIHRTWEMKTHLKSLSYHEKSLSSVTNELLPVMSKHKIATAWAYLRLTRTITTLDTSLADLFPKINYQKILKRYFRQREKRLIQKNFDPKTIRQVFAIVPEMISEYQIHLEPQLRRSALTFEGYSHKIDQFLSTTMQNLFFVATVVSTFFLINFVFTVYPNVARFFKANYLLETLPILAKFNVFLFDTMITNFGRHAFFVWHMLALVDIYILYQLIRSAIRFKEKEVNLPTFTKSKR